jgi:hypothetical protein
LGGGLEFGAIGRVEDSWRKRGHGTWIIYHFAE